MTEQSPQPRKINWLNVWTIAGGVAGVVAAVAAVVTLALPPSPATSSGSPSGSSSIEPSHAPTLTSTPPNTPTTTTIAPKPKQWTARYVDTPLHLQDSVVIDFDGDIPRVKTQDFPGGDINFTNLGGNTWSDEPVVLSVHDGPNATPESCTTSLDTGPTTSTYMSDDTPYMCVRTGEGAIAFIKILETITDYRITVTLWQFA
ncbi:hypothetical protein [Saccharothrix sp. NRRL B-16314]|uniref:hypothetical protein n=1 Tax=Saccharothrix sp. NRRL B-16314 TaxID=1463825 RepID=UPI0012DE0689|nr:hypothetical protein [Saccharothrix sp. NRRL B-16314]